MPSRVDPPKPYHLPVAGPNGGSQRSTPCAPGDPQPEPHSRIAGSTEVIDQLASPLYWKSLSSDRPFAPLLVSRASSPHMLPTSFASLLPYH